MNKMMKRAGILVVIFVAAVLIYFIGNREAFKQTGTVYEALGEAELPIVSVLSCGREMNEMHGYRTDMGKSVARESLTVLPEDRALPIQVGYFDGAVLGIRYEIRSLDLERLVENTKLESWETKDQAVSAVLPIQNLLTRDREYLLRIDIDTERYGTVYYYTRILWTESSSVMPMVELAVDFSAKTFYYDQARELVTYLETNDKEDNSSFGKTTIRSSFSQLTWGRLKMQPKGRVHVTLKDLDGIMGCVELTYQAARQDESGNEELYEVKENFTMKWNEQRIYMMEYKRTVDQVFQGSQESYAGKRIMLGITNENMVGVKASPGNQVLAFRANRELWSYDQRDRRAVKIFSFRDNREEDRGSYQQHDIKILKVEDNGDMDFLVYGYMNQGNHEGYLGITGYRYDESENAIEEQFFIPVKTTYEQLGSDLAQLTYRSSAEMLYLYVDHAIYGIDLNSNEYLVVADALAGGNYAVSSDQTRIAWQEGGKLYESTTIHLMDLETGTKKEIKSQDKEYLRTLGFVGRDLIYGMAREGDLWVENGRTMELPMYALEIRNDSMEVETRYERQGYYVAHVTVEESRIHLNRVTRLSGQAYSLAQEDTIVCNVDMGPGALDGIGWYASQDKGKLYFVQVDNEIKSSRNIRVSTPKKVSYDHSGTLELKSNYQIQGMQFNAYSNGTLLGTSTDFTEALNLAYSGMGLVTDQNHRILWSRVNRGNIRNIRDTVTAATPLLRHLDGFTASRSFNDGVTVLDARGCTLSQVLYFVDRGIPVFAYNRDGSYLLLTGYDPYNVTVYYPDTRESVKIGLGDSEAYFKQQGNDFLCAVADD